MIEINFSDGGGRGVTDFIDQMNRERVLYCYFLPGISCVFFAISFFRGYFGVGSGTHYMYFRERIYKIWWKYRVLCFDKEFCLFLIRMVFFKREWCFEDYCVRILCDEVWGVMLPIDCFAILLMITRCEWWGPLFISMTSWELSPLTRIHVVSTASDPKIPPKKRTIKK